MADHIPSVEVLLEKSAPEQRVAGHASHVATGLGELTNGGYVQQRQDVHVDANLNVENERRLKAVWASEEITLAGRLTRVGLGRTKEAVPE